MDCNEKGPDAMGAEKPTIEGQILQIRAMTKNIENGEPIGNVCAGLQPYLEDFMWELLFVLKPELVALLQRYRDGRKPVDGT